jgi:hypothetical protein
VLLNLISFKNKGCEISLKDISAIWWIDGRCLPNSVTVWCFVQDIDFKICVNIKIYSKEHIYAQLPIILEGSSFNTYSNCTKLVPRSFY